MDRTEFTRDQQVHWYSCKQTTPSYDIVNYGSMEQGYRQLCSRCFNAEVVKLVGLEKFENLKFESVVVVDYTGGPHEFHFHTHLFGTGVALDALELRGGNPAGYQFRTTGNAEDDLLVLLVRLIEKIRRALSIKHLTDGEHGCGLRIADHQVVQGRIEWDDAQDGRLPFSSSMVEIFPGTTLAAC